MKDRRGSDRQTGWRKPRETESRGLGGVEVGDSPREKLMHSTEVSIVFDHGENFGDDTIIHLSPDSCTLLLVRSSL